MTSWDVDMVILVRGLINDLDSTTYSNARLQELICIAGQLAKNDVSFDYVYSITLTNPYTISPDPVAVDDNPFINLVSLKTACLILRSEYKSLAAQVASFRDAQTAIDNTAQLKGKGELMKQMCAGYDEATLQYLAGDRNPGRAIFGPISHPDICINPNGATGLSDTPMTGFYR